MDNNADNILQHLLEEMLRPLQTGLPPNPNYREPIISRNPQNNHYSQLFHALRDIMVVYNSNISDYNNNITTSLQLMRLILEERNRQVTTYRNQSNQVPEVAQFRPYVENLDSSNNMLPNRNNDHLFSYVLYRPTIRSEDDGALRRLFQNIVVRPTAEQIDYATTLVPFHANEENVNNSCPITMEEFQEGEMVRLIRHCHHQFQEEPIQNWFRSNVRCPVCRYDIRDYLPETGSRPDTTTEPSPEEVQPPINALPGYHEILQEITQNFADDINDIIADSFQTNAENGIPDVSQNFVFDFHVETNL